MAIELLATLRARDSLAQVTDADLDAKLTVLAGQRTISAYAGFDPTADCLHVGHFIPILGLMHAQRQGIRPIALVGGATGLIGDPSGKSTERNLLSKEQVAHNVAAIQGVLRRFLDFDDPRAPAMMANNLDWFGPMGCLDFLRDVGKHFRVGAMLSKDSVKARMDDAGEGISYTEFSYQLLQGYDYFRLYKDHGCVLQMGGSDQWGNITAGTDCIRRLEGLDGVGGDERSPAFGLTLPLLTDSAGKKLGKSEGNAVWLRADKTSVYEFYQYWIREIEDADVIRILKFITFLPLEEIQQLEQGVREAPHQREAQKALARTLTTLVHGSDATRQAIAASQVMFGGSLQGLDAATLELAMSQVPSVRVASAQLAQGWPVVDAAVAAGLCDSKGKARQLISSGGFYVNNEPMKDPQARLTTEHLAAPGLLVLRSGKKEHRLVRVGEG